MTPDEAVHRAFAELGREMEGREARHELWQTLGGRAGGTRAILSALGMASSKSNMRLVQRWVSLSGQQREPGPANRAQLGQLATRERIRESGLRVHFEGRVQVSNDKRRRDKEIDIDAENPYVARLLDALASGNQAAVTAAVQQAFFEAWGPGLEGAAFVDVDALELDFG